MLRRKPTRLELKLDDIEEFESIRKDLEVSIPLESLGIFKTITFTFELQTLLPVAHLKSLFVDAGQAPQT